ncbi:MAG: PQQ-dependent sugar dehydrogenase, partial [Lentisphaeraceae bacterium]|nr:PQQ-dependent sugar dehydrogenase [Lentisphaeraceae bacterium]
SLVLDISSKVDDGGESGLLSIAFHPNFASNNTFYAFYTSPHNGSRHQFISRFVITGSGVNETVLIRQQDQAGNHNGGDMHFGFDGYLYISAGDEGNQNDSLNNSQRIDKDFFSAILRIDVDRKSGNLEPNDHPAVVKSGGTAHYKIPADNPWVGATSFNGSSVNPNNVRTEFYAVGFRNPWRMSFDPAGNLWIGDVGQGSREEIDFVPNGQKGMNFGWNFREGFIAGPRSAPPGVNPDNPIHDYDHGNSNFSGKSVTGGVFYTGNQIPSIKNNYIFGDYVSGNVWQLEKSGSQVSVEYITNEKSISAFGLNPETGEVLICKYDTGKILKLVEGSGNENEIPTTLSATGAFSNLANLDSETGIEPYEPNVTFWSDYALKKRWFSLPNINQKFGFKTEGGWNYPAGSVWIKHFDLEMERGNPNSAVRVETRFLVKTANGAYGLSYRWNNAGTEATLSPPEGENIYYNINSDGVSTPKTWTIPSRSSCLECHTATAGFALSFNTRQLNRNFNIFGSNQNILTGLYNEGYLDVNPGNPASLAKHFAANDSSASIEQKARSYMDVNCSYCHQEGGPTPAEFDARALLSNFETGLINGVPLNNGGDSSRRLILPGDPNKSVVLSRISETNGFTRMPPIATTELDHSGMDLIRDWINSLSNTGLPSPFQLNDVNNSNASASYSGGVFSISAGGHDIWGNSDSFGYVNQQVNGDTTIISKVENLTRIHPWSKAGVMIRQGTNASSTHAMVVVTPDNGISMQYRPVSGQRSYSTKIGGLTAPQWVKLVRTNNWFRGFYSSDGQNWILIDEVEIAMNSNSRAGIVLTSHAAGTNSQANFTNLEVRKPDNSEKVFQQSYKTADIANSNFTQSESNGNFNMSAAGADIWGRSDEFGFTYVEWTGDVTLIAKVNSLNNVHEWSKAGVMIRTSLNANSRHASMFATFNRASAHWRITDGGTSTPDNVQNSETQPPMWVKMMREGNVFRAYYSFDGGTWHPNGVRIINMPEKVYVGIALTSHVRGTNASASISNVEVKNPDSEVYVRRFVLTNADTKTDLLEMKDRIVIDRAVLGTNNFNIRADLSEDPGSVEFNLNNALRRYEHYNPYYFNGDDGSWLPAPGDYIIDATPSSEGNGGGVKGETLKVRITIR